MQEAQLYELLSGAVASLRQLGVVLTGGHTTEGSELALGFAVTANQHWYKVPQSRVLLGLALPSFLHQPGFPEEMNRVN